MRKTISETFGPSTPLSIPILEKLVAEGYLFVLVKGITADRHYEHIEPHCLLLIPIRELPEEQAEKDIYAPVTSPLLREWAGENETAIEVFVAGTGW